MPDRTGNHFRTLHLRQSLRKERLPPGWIFANLNERAHTSRAERKKPVSQARIGAGVDVAETNDRFRPRRQNETWRTVERMLDDIRRDRKGCALFLDAHLIFGVKRLTSDHCEKYERMMERVHFPRAAVGIIQHHASGIDL